MAHLHWSITPEEIRRIRLLVDIHDKQLLLQKARQVLNATRLARPRLPDQEARLTTCYTCSDCFESPKSPLGPAEGAPASCPTPEKMRS